jgi:predicted DNA-binding transcriptional regulator AlpA
MNKSLLNTTAPVPVSDERVRTRDWPSRKLRVPEAATFCGCSISKLNKHRVTGDGPPFIRCGRLVSYDIHDLEAWLAQGKRRSTSEQP